MTNPQQLTAQQILVYKSRIASNDLIEVGRVYDELYAKGYNYAGWARGVVRGNSVSGQAAVEFLASTSMMDVKGINEKTVGPFVMDMIEISMAKGYLATLENIAGRSGGIVSRDVTFNETKDFHESVF